MRNTKNWLMMMLALPVLYACDESDTVDTIAPEITLEDPISGEAFAAGSTMHVHGDLSDDQGLATYSISIHSNFDGHSHGRVLAQFAFSESYEAEGTAAHIEQEIEIDATATAGPYHFIVEAIDAAGNATSFQDDSSIEIEIWIENEDMAHIHFTDENDVEIDEIEGVLGENLPIYGEVEDESGTLDHVYIMVGHLEEGEDEDHDHSHGRVLEDHIFEEEYEVEGESSVLLQDLLASESIVVNQEDMDELEDGEHLYLIVQATDEDGNVSRSTIEIHFD
ncbi:DUF4625 domain-containing protein [Reichenbachiella carrageenanivorans]|uniref:DUF4625 domain-containing protein n=1 Tax=Reichenbachiella carrageenanivorans TaxID=2979869 RepID=A0ABY6CUT8_9BACT|nr:DUF4625 domain-containing protein [Reichenbachiella carrageenanivorans]UXX77687.1 DUF4625 domain-containing protein [Reichenbachiella carrageenanivorans]